MTENQKERLLKFGFQKALFDNLFNHLIKFYGEHRQHELIIYDDLSFRVNCYSTSYDEIRNDIKRLRIMGLLK